MRYHPSLIRSVARHLLGGAAVLTLMAPTPYVPGVTYRIRMTTKLPDFANMMGAMAGGGAGGGLMGTTAGPVVLARASAIGGKARIDFQAVEGMGGVPMGINDYLIVTDTSSITISPDTKTYSQGAAIQGGIGGMASMMGGMGRGGRGGGRGGGGGADPAAVPATPDLQIRDVKFELKKLGAGEVIDGRPTQHYMLMLEQSVFTRGQLTPIKMTIELWTAKIPPGVVNPFDALGSGNYERTGTAVELNAKLEAVRRQLDGSPVKTITTVSLTDLMGGRAMGGAGGAGGRDMSAALAGMKLDFVQTLQITGITQADVDPTRLAIPDGYTKR